MTVRGAVPADILGIVHPHEHILLNVEWIDARFSLDGILNDADLAVEELQAFVRMPADTRSSTSRIAVCAPTRCAVRVASPSRRESRRDGLRLVSPAVLPGGGPDRPDLDRASRGAAGARTSSTGSYGTDVRPGIIGEIGSHKDFVTAQEERVFRAAGRAAVRTGPGGEHPLGGQSRRAGAPADSARRGRRPGSCRRSDTRIAIHFWSTTWRCCEQGAYVQFDNIGYRLPGVAALESKLIPLTVEFVRQGWAHRLLLSQDVCHRSHLKAYGGNGYDYLLSRFLPTLRAAGVDEGSIEQMTVHNPRRLLSGV